MPEIQKVEPEANDQVDLDAAFIVTFNQPMDTASVQSNFSLTGPAGKVTGAFKWNKNNTTLTFSPSNLLKRDSDYTLIISAQAKGRGGTAIGRTNTYPVRTYPDFRGHIPRPLITV